VTKLGSHFEKLKEERLSLSYFNRRKTIVHTKVIVKDGGTKILYSLELKITTHRQIIIKSTEATKKYLELDEAFFMFKNIVPAIFCFYAKTF